MDIVSGLIRNPRVENKNNPLFQIKIDQIAVMAYEALYSFVFKHIFNHITVSLQCQYHRFVCLLKKPWLTFCQATFSPLTN